MDNIFIDKAKTDELAGKVERQAGELYDAMVDLGIRHLEVNDHHIHRNEMAANGGQFPYSTLTMDNSGDLTSANSWSNDENPGSYYTGDFNSWIAYPSSDDLIAFAEIWEQIVTAIKELSASTEERIDAATESLNKELEY